MTISDVVSDKQNMIHNSLYKDALNSFLIENPDFKSDRYIIHELSDNTKNYYESSKIVIFDSLEFKRYMYNLNVYWPKYVFINKKSVFNRFNIYEYELVDKNFNTGIDILKHRYSGEILFVPFGKIPDDINVSNGYLLSNTFTEKYNVVK